MPAQKYRDAPAERDDAHDLRRQRLAWVAVVIESLGLLIATLGIVWIHYSLTISYLMMGIGAPLLIIGVFLIWLTAH